MSIPGQHFVVRIDRAKALKGRKREWRAQRRLAWAVAIFAGFFFGIAVICMFGAAADMAANSWMLGSAALLGMAGVANAAVAVPAFAKLRSKPGYWSAEDLPDIAFAMDGAGVEFHSTLGAPVMTVPWESIREVKIAGKTLQFSTAPGALPAKFKDRIYYGWPILDQIPPTVKEAMRVLSSGRVNAGV